MAGTIAADTLTHSTAGSIATNFVVEGSAKAWVNFNGTGTIASRDSFNIASLTDNGTGQYLLSYSSSMGNDDYVLTGGARSPGSTSGIFNAPTDAASDQAAGSTEVYHLNLSGGPTDFTHDFVIVHGDLA
jgi:hypothetical protein